MSSVVRVPHSVADVAAGEQGILLRMLSCVVADKEALYVSGPITTGPRFVGWHQNTGYLLEHDKTAYADALRENVLKPNEREILECASALRAKQRLPVIEPASLHIPAWRQAQYHNFWTAVLERFVSSVVVLEGWQFSVGCAVEFNYASKSGIPVRTAQGHSIDTTEGRKLISRAAEEVAAATAPTKALNWLAHALQQRALSDGD